MYEPAHFTILAQAASQLTDAVETSHRLTWQGPLSLTQAITIAVALILLSGTALWAEARLTGRRVAVWFWPLRILVLSLVTWMLLQPTHTTVQRRTEQKSLAVIADTSGSMDIIDAADAPTDLRWTYAARSGGDAPVTLCDRLLVAAGEMQVRLRSAEELASRPRTAIRLKQELDGAERAGNVARECLGKLDAAALPAEARPQFETLTTVVRDELSPGIERLLEQDAVGSPQERAAALRALAAKAEQARQTARLLAAKTVAAATAHGELPATGQLSVQRSRREKVDDLLANAETSWLGAAGKEARIQRWTFDAGMEPVTAAEWKRAIAPGAVSTDAPDDGLALTNLTALLEQIGRSAASDRLEAVVLLTDGRHNAPGARDPLEIAASLGHLPIYIVPVGDDRLVRDLLVHHLEAPRAVAKDDKIVLEALVTAIDCAGERVKVELLTKDQFDKEAVVDQHEFTPETPRIDERVSFSVQRSDVGRYEFRVRAAPIADEASPDNNQESVTVDVVETDIRVLLADEAPRWEFRYLSRLFERDKHIEYDQLLFQPSPAGTGDLENSLQLPADVEDWNKYRVVVLGDLPPERLPRSAQTGLRDFVVERGGTLILIAGARAMPDAYARLPLGELLPVLPNPTAVGNASYTVALTAEGRLSPAVQVADDPGESERAWNDAFRFTPLPWLSDYRRPKPTAHTLLRAVSASGQTGRDEQDAVLCWQSIGRGRVVYFSAPDTYRLRARHGDRYHHAFWGQLLRWSIAPDLSAGSKTVQIRTDKQRYDAREPVQITVELRSTDGQPVPAAKVRAVAEQYGKMVAQIDLAGDARAPGQYTGRFDQLPDGSLTIRPVGDEIARLLASESYTKDVTAPVVISQQLNAEMNDTRSNPALLARIAELTGGQVIPPTAAAEIPRLAMLAPKVTETESHQPLWNTWWILATISGCLIVEWIARKRLSLQ
ncbi:MAG: hypothetical protein U0992_22695 [Planctomycetaceae bacterium]